jgi:hypothetical protein
MPIHEEQEGAETFFVHRFIGISNIGLIANGSKCLSGVAAILNLNTYIHQRYQK